MASSSHHQQALPSKRPKIESHNENPNPTSTAVAASSAADKGKSVISPSQEDENLSNSTHLTHQEVLQRRSHYIRQLAKCYREHYWALMEELKILHRDYVWKFGLSPFSGDNNEKNESREIAGDGGGVTGIYEGTGETNANNNGGNLLCAFYGCKYKAMALTSFCHLHILTDKKQQLYKPCNYVIKSALAGAITCGKPILRSTVPSLCNIHLQKAQKHVNRALKKAGLNVSPSSKLAPKLHVVVAEYVREIQGKRKAAMRENRKKGVVKSESCS